MDLAKRQEFQRALTAAADHGMHIVVRVKGCDFAILPDFVCFETYVEATATDGETLALRYEEIESVSTSV